MNTATIKLRIGELFHLSPDICVICTHTHILYANEAYCRVLGWTEMECLDVPFRDRSHPDDLASIEEAVKSMENAALVNFTARHKTKDGRYIPIVWSATRWVNGLSFAIGRVTC